MIILEAATLSAEKSASVHNMCAADRCCCFSEWALQCKLEKIDKMETSDLERCEQDANKMRRVRLCESIHVVMQDEVYIWHVHIYFKCMV